mmetsp:Transcript_46454/g.132891  ORF Transcript_46454/g.132891 Transcript_46454/m.132891 type:complete len:231 (+) Transcript_46454:91-783(+)
MASPLTLVYFKLRARGEAVRMVARYSGVPVAEEIVELEEWPALKPTMPKGQLPVLRLSDGSLMPESVDIALFLARQPIATRQLVTDEASVSLLTWCAEPPISMADPLLNWFDKDDAAAKLGPYLEEARPLIAERDAELQASAGPFFAGESPGVGDFGLFHIASNIEVLGHIGRDDASIWQEWQLSSKWMDWLSAIAALPGVQEYLAERPKTGVGAMGKPGSLASTTVLDH